MDPSLIPKAEQLSFIGLMNLVGNISDKLMKGQQPIVDEGLIEQSMERSRERLKLFNKLS